MNTKISILLLSFVIGFSAFTNTVSAQYAVPTCNSATLHGDVDTNGVNTEVWFEWGQGGSISWSTPGQFFSQNSSFSQLLTNLVENTTYSYRAMAENEFGTAIGQVRTFTTAICTTPQQQPTVNLTADDSSVPFNGATTLRWTSSNATSCSASGGTNGWAGTRQLNSTFFTGNLQNTTTYSITCSNSAGSVSDSVTVSVQSQQPTIPQPTVSLTADNTNLPFNTGTTLRWSSTSATSCSASGGTNGWAGTRPTSGVFSTGNLTNPITYSITCINSTGSATDSVTVNVQPQQPTALQPTVNLTADNSNVPFNTGTVVRWTSTNAISCNASGGTNGWSGGKNTSGTFNTGNLTNTVTYVITCANNTNSATDSVTVTVGNQQPTQQPTVDISANDTSVNFNNGTIVNWTSSNATSCNASGGTNGWAGTRQTSGSFTTGALTNTVTFSINCFNSAGNASDSVTITVGGQQPNQPTVDLTVDNSNISFNSATTVRWTSSNANSCNASGGTNGWSGSRPTSGSFATGNLTNTVTYTITCSNSSGSASDSVTVIVSGQSGNAPTVDIWADDTSINNNSSTVIRWTSNNANNCSSSGGTNGWSGGNRGTSGSFNTGNLTNTVTYTINCSNNNGSASDSVTVFVNGNNNNQVSVDIWADNTNINYNSSTVVRWNSNNANHCNSSGGTNSWSSNNRGTSGSFNTGNLTNTVTFTITCYSNNNSSSDSDSVTINVSGQSQIQQQQPFVDLTADSYSASYNSSTIVRWYSNNASSCFATGGTNGWQGNRGLSGSFNTGALTQTTTFYISCANSSGNAFDSVTIFVSGQPIVYQQPTIYQPPAQAYVAPTSLVTLASAIDVIGCACNVSAATGGPLSTNEILYTVNYHNTSSSNARNLSLQVTLPQEASYVSSAPYSPSVSGQTLSFNLGNLPAGSKGAVMIRARARDNLANGTNLNFYANLNHTTPSGQMLSVNDNVSTQLYGNTFVNNNPSSGYGEIRTTASAATAGLGALTSGIVGWLLLVVLVLLIIILVRHLLTQSQKRTIITTSTP